ncbi:MAG: peptidoglycan-binding protein [Clostridia bacterium]|nr:peptidoglycan-binding protein [Clostridia bacterium]
MRKYLLKLTTILMCIVFTASTITASPAFAAGDYDGNITKARWYWPIHDYTSTTSAYSRIISSYGYRGTDPSENKVYNRYHYGVDIAQSRGTVVYPVRKGIVHTVDNNTAGAEGRSIVINHEDGYFSVYMHLSKISVFKEGQKVDINTPIGSVGGSGDGTETRYGNHLHLGIHYGSSYDSSCNVNPCPQGYTRKGNSLQETNGGRPVGSASINYYLYKKCSTDHKELGTKNYHTSDSGVLGACKECGEAYDWQSTFSTNIQQLYLKKDSKTYKAIVRKAPYKDAECLSDDVVFDRLNVLGTVTNAYGNTWYAIYFEDDVKKMCYTAYVYSDHIEKYSDSESDNSYQSSLPPYQKPTLTTIVSTAKQYDSGNISTAHSHDYTYNNGQCYCGETKTTQQNSTLNIDLTAYPTSIRQGSPFSLSGTITSNYTIKKVSGYIKQGDVVYDSSEDIPNSKKLNVKTANLNNSLLFGKLSPGNYTLCVEAIDVSGQVIKINKNFTVSGESKAESTLRINLEKYPVSLNIRSSFNILGDISSNYPISRVRGYIYSSDGSLVQSTTDTPNSTYMDIRPANLNQRLTFGKLSSGNYTMKIEAVDTSGKVVTATKSFTVNGTSSTQSVLRNGSSGSAVKELQNNLNQIMNAGLTVDGIFGNDTENAVREFQSRYGLTVDGIAGQATLSKINEILTAPTTPNVPASTKKAITNTNQILSNGSSGSAVKELQTALNRIMNAGLTVDGIFGNGTQQAVKNFQSKYGLSVDGIAGPNTLNKINDILK